MLPTIGSVKKTHVEFFIGKGVRMDQSKRETWKYFLRSAVVTIAIATLLYGCWSYDTWRYRLTVNVSTPEGLKTGSVVREISRLQGIRLLPEMGAEISVSGEAVVVDLGSRGVLFALIGGDYGARILLDAFRIASNDPITYETLPKQGKITLTRKLYPMFSRFEDLNDPKTIQNVLPSDEVEQARKLYPQRPIFSFQEAFGNNVLIRDVTLEITSDPITWGIEKYLPWVMTIGNGNLAGKRYSGTQWYEQLNKSQFKMGVQGTQYLIRIMPLSFFEAWGRASA